MWPWEHLAVGYLTYSLLVRIGTGGTPTTAGAVAVAVGTQFPDLIDKPLGWGTTLLPAGQSLAHSLLFAGPVVVLATVLGLATDRMRLAVAFAVGYLSHLPGDVLYPVLLGGDLNLSFLLWPVWSASGSEPTAIFAHVRALFAQFLVVMGSPRGMVYLLFEVGLVFGALAVWILDGTPGLPTRSRRATRDPR